MSTWYYRVMDSFGGIKLQHSMVCPTKLNEGSKLSCFRLFSFSERLDFLPEHDWIMLGDSWRLTAEVSLNSKNLWDYELLIAGTDVEKIQDVIRQVESVFRVPLMKFGSDGKIVPDENIPSESVTDVLPEATEDSCVLSSDVLEQDLPEGTSIGPVIMEFPVDEEYVQFLKEADGSSSEESSDSSIEEPASGEPAEA